MGELLKGKSAVVTGAGRGIGKEIALALAAEGASVVVNDLGGALNGTGDSTAPADETVAEIEKTGGKAIPSYDSVAEYESAGKIIKTCMDSFGRIDILVNFAGNYVVKMSYEMTPKEWDSIVKVHLYGTFYCSRHALPHMIEQKWGRIVSATSDAYRGLPGSVCYSAAKGGIVSLMRSMALEVAQFGINCNCIAPGAGTRLTMGPEAQAKYKRAFEAGAISREVYESLQDIPSAKFIAPMVAYLASENGAPINGCVLGCSGGKISLHSLVEEFRAVFKDCRKEGPWTMEELKRIIPQTIEASSPSLKSPAPVGG